MLREQQQLFNFHLWSLSKICIKFSKISSREPFIYYLHDVISLINNETKRRMIIQKSGT